MLPIKLRAEAISMLLVKMVRDFSKFALELHNKPSSTEPQMDYARKMIRKPVVDEVRYQKVWKEHVYPMKNQYQMNP